ncbi:MAG TPA: universal stress protein [Armatimonadota bacterium]|nr:universal stress protein [Armatimonadota bacterium]
MADAVEKFRQEQYKVLVGLAHPDTLRGLMSIAAVFARRHQGRIVAVSVVTVPEGTEPAEGAAHADPDVLAGAEEIVGTAADFCAELGLAAEPVVEFAHDVPSGIIDAAARHEPDMVLLGFSPPAAPDPATAEAPARITEQVATRMTSCTLGIVAFPEGRDSRPRLLLPVTESFDPEIVGDLTRIAALFAGAEVSFLVLLPSSLSNAEMDRRSRDMRTRIEALDLGEIESLPLECRAATDCLFGAEVARMGGEEMRPAFLMRARL